MNSQPRSNVGAATSAAGSGSINSNTNLINHNNINDDNDINRIKRNRSSTYGTLPRGHYRPQTPPPPPPRPATPIRYHALRRRYTNSSRLPNHSRPPQLVTLFRNPIRLVPIVIVIVVLSAFIYTFPRQWAPPGGDPSLDPHRPIRYKKSSFDWAGVKHRYPVPEGDMKKLPDGRPVKEMRKVQHDFGPTYASDPATQSRRTAVRKVAQKSWVAYREKAWGKDVLRPVTGVGRDDHAGWSLSLVEALDTLWIMDLKSEFHEAAALAAELDFGTSPASGLWTVDLATRYLGGLLSAYDLSGLNPLLLKAKEVGEMVYLAFDTENRMPTDWFSFEGAQTGRLAAGQRTQSHLVALVLEMTRLAQITRDNRFYDAGDMLMEFLASSQMGTRLPGMWPEQLDLSSGDVGRDNVFSISHTTATLYWTLPSMYMVTGGLEGDRYAGMYKRAMAAVEDEILWRAMLPGDRDIIFPGTLYAHRDQTDLVAQTTSTGCSLAAILAVGGKLFDLPHHMELSDRLLKSCVWAHLQFPTRLIPQTFNMLRCPAGEEGLSLGCEWDEREWLDERRDRRLREGFTHVPDRRFLQGPGTVESLFVLWRTTGRKELRNEAFAMFEKITRETKAHWGYAGVQDVLDRREEMEGMVNFMASDWLGSTLKYFYLIYTHPHDLDLDEWVFTCAGHPLRRPISLEKSSGILSNGSAW